MPRRRVPSRVLATSVAALLGFFTYTQTASAQQYWDGTGGEATVLEAGYGIWNSLNPNWSLDPGGATNTVYDPTLTAIFGNNGVLGGTIGIGDNLQFTNLTFASNGYFLVGTGTFGLTPTGTGILNVQAGISATVAVPFLGTGGTNVAGPGILTLLGDSKDYQGDTTLSNGTLIVNSNTALGSGTLIITSTGGPTTLGTYYNGTTIPNNISVQSDFSVTTGSGGLNLYLNGDIDLNGATRVINGVSPSSQIQFGGTISNGSLTYATPFNAVGDYVAFILMPGNVNTYTGLTTIGNGAFIVLQGSANNGAINGDVLITGNGVLDYLGTSGASPFSSEQVADNATVTVNSMGNYANGERFTGIDLYQATGVETIGTLNGTGSVGLASGTLAVSAGNFSGIITDGYHGARATGNLITGGKLTKYGAGTLTLSGSNNYTGVTTINGGTLQAGAAGTFSASSAVVVTAAGTLDLNSLNQSIASLAGSGTVTLGAATLTTGLDNTATTFSGVIQGAGGLTKTGTGAMTLSGANTYTGATTVNAGTLIVDTATNASVLAPASSLVLGGGKFQLKGVSGAVRGQVINGGFTLSGGASDISVDNNGGTSTTLDLSASGINRTGGGTVDFAAASGVLGTTAIVRTGQANDGTGIIGPWATVDGGAAYAANDGAGVIVAYTGYANIASTDMIADGTASNVRINSGGSGTVTLGSNPTNINTLTQNTAATVTVDTGGGTLRLGTAGGLMITKSGGELIIGTPGNAGTLTAGGGADNVPGEIVVGNFSGSGMTINSVIADNGAGVVTLTKTGTGALTLNGVNTYTGLTTVNEGTVNLNATGGNAIAGNILINGGTIALSQSDQIADTSSVTVASGVLNIADKNETVGAVHLTGGTINGSTGTLTSASNYDLQSGSVGAILGGAVGLDKTSTGTVALSGKNTYTGATNIAAGTLRTDADNAISVSSAVTVASNAVFDLNSTSQSVGSISGSGSILLDYGRLTVGSDGSSTTFSGVIDGRPDLRTSTSSFISGGGLTKVGGGTLTLSAQNTYSGSTIISAGTLQAGVANAIYKTSPVSIELGATFDLNNLNQSVGSISDGTIGGGTISLGTATLTVGNKDFNVLNQILNTQFSGVITGTGGLTKVGSFSTLTLAGANTYTGVTTIKEGQIRLSGSLAGTVVVGNDGSQDGGSAKVVFTVLSGGSVSLGTGVTVVTMTSVNNLVNSGTLQAGDNSTVVSAIDFNRIDSEKTITAGNNSTAIKAASTNTIRNFLGGTITVGTNSFAIDAISSNLIQNFASIVAGSDSTGIRVMSQNTIANSGTMTVGDNGVGVSVGSENAVSNTGTITAGANSQGFLVRGTNNTLVNEKGGNLSAATGVLVTATSGSNVVGNLGTLTGTGGNAYDSTASLAGQRLTNAGTIVGNVRFGVGNDTMSVSTGSIANGIINGGAGVNTFRLVGTGKDTYDIGNPNLQNFSILEKDGGSVWTITGERAFTGGTTVKAGELIVNGNLISNTSVQQAGILSGFGMITGNVSNFGTISPGTIDTSGTFKINGNFQQGNRGTLVIQIAGKNAASNDLLAVSGQAQLGGNLRIDKVGKVKLKLGDKITFLTAAGGVDGEFDRVDNPFNSKSKTMILTELVYDSNSVSLQAVQGSFVDFAERLDLSRNQKAVARSIDAAIAEGKNQKMVDFLNKQSLTKIPAELDRVAPEELTAIYRVGVGVANAQNQNIQRRTEDLRLTNRRVTTSFQTNGQAPGYSGQIGAEGETGADGQAGPAVRAPRPSDRKWGAFLNGMGDWIRIGNTENARGYELETAGTTAGVDYRVGPNFAVGASVGYTNTSARLTEEGRLRVNGGRIGTYATYFDGGFHADASVSGGYSEYYTERAALQGRTRGRTEGAEFNAALGAGYDWTLEALTLGALTSLEYTYLDIDGFTEQGSLAPLRFPDQQGQSIRSKLGFKATYDWQLGKVLLRPEFRALWQHEFGERSLALDSQLASGAGGVFTVYDPAVGRDSLLLGLGTSVLWSPRTSTYLYYDGEIYRKESESHNISGGLRISF